MSKENKTACLVIPCFNTGDYLEVCFSGLALCDHLIDVFICIDDGSQDNTAQVLKELKSTYPIILLRHKTNRGYGAAQKTGYAEALRRRFDVAILYHSDGQMDPKQIPIFLQKIEEGYDFVSGSRMLAGGMAKGGMPFYKIVGHHVLTWLPNLLLRTDFKGYGDGYRAYTATFLRQSEFQRMSDSFTFDTEIFLAAHKLEIKWDQIPVPTIYKDEISNLKAIRYGLGILLVSGRYLLRRT